MAVIYSPKVSIIVPVYNIESYLPLSLDSIIGQNYNNLEIIIVDDGSTDDTYQIAERYSRQDTRIKLVKQKNQGVSAARNIALSKVTGDYYMFVDGDDILSSMHVNLFLDLALKNNADVVSADVVMVYGNNINVTGGVESGSAELIGSSDAVKRHLYLKGINNYVVAKIYKTSIHGSLRFNESLRIGEDMVYVHSVLRASENIVVYSGSTYFYLQRRGSAMNGKFSINRFDSYAAAKIILDGVESDASIIRAAKTKLFSEAVTLLGEVYRHRAQYDEIYKVCAQTSLMFAFSTIINDEARGVTRVYAILRLISIRLLSSATSYKRRKINDRMNR